MSCQYLRIADLAFPVAEDESQCNDAIEKLLSEALPLIGDIKTQSGNSAAFSAAKRDRQFDVYVGLPTVDDANPAVKNIKKFVRKKLAKLGIPARPEPEFLTRN